jgi:hypothetical protein
MTQNLDEAARSEISYVNLSALPLAVWKMADLEPGSFLHPKVL